MKDAHCGVVYYSKISVGNVYGRSGEIHRHPQDGPVQPAKMGFGF